MASLVMKLLQSSNRIKKLDLLNGLKFTQSIHIVCSNDSINRLLFAFLQFCYSNQLFNSTLFQLVKDYLQCSGRVTSC